MNRLTFYDDVSSPLGPIIVSSDGESLTGVRFNGQRYFIDIPDGWQKYAGHPVLEEAKRQLSEYFTGIRKAFDLPLNPDGTVFQKAVWRNLQGIPLGATASYLGVAAGIGRPSAVRAVGTAIGRNPLCIVVPCHRVLTAGGALGGYVAGLERKQKLLQLEGAMLV